MAKLAKTLLTVMAILLSTGVAGQQSIKTFRDLISHIDQRTKFSFSYPDDLLDKTINIDNQVNLNDAGNLRASLAPYGIEVLKRRKTLIFKEAKIANTSRPYQLSGYVRDAQSGESLIGAHVIDLSTGTGVVTNVYGYFSLSISGDSLYVGYLGYEIKKMARPTKPESVVISLQQSAQVLEALVVTDDVELQELNQISTLRLSPAQVKAMPVFMGESDVMKALQLMPGVQAGNDGSSGIYVRGGGPDQNLILLDGVPVYNANHLFGFFSVFNTDAVNNVELIKGGFPARYGGRLSSVVDIQMKEGNPHKTEGEGTLGLIASKFTIGGPIGNGKTSYIFSGRRTYLDLFTVPIAQLTDSREIFAYNFWDVNAKINHTFSSKDRIFLSAYAGRDRYYQKIRNNPIPTISEKENSNLHWGNITSAFRWNHRFSDRLFSNLTAIYTRYRFGLNSTIDINNSADQDASIYRENDYFSNINDIGLKYDFNWYLTNKHQVQFGANYLHHTLKPGISSYKSHTETDTTFGAQTISLDEFFVYAEDNIQLTPTTQVNVGTHFSGASVEGQNYYSLQPRITVNQRIGTKWSIKGAYSRMAQYIHLLVNSGVGLPTDLWVPTTRRVKPQTSEQYVLGVATTRGGFELSVESFYKNMDNLVEYKDGAGFLDIVNEWESKLEFGKGRSYGIEWLVRKNKGRSTGWIGYTWSRSNRTFENLNFGRTFPYKYDRRHDISVVYNLKINGRMDFGAVWVFGTGNAATLPSASFPKATWNTADNTYDAHVKNFPGKNATRMANYHRLDLSLTLTKQKKKGVRKWIFGLYNAYSRQNPIFLGFKEPSVSNPSGQFTQTSLFPIIPNVSYQFKF